MITRIVIVALFSTLALLFGKKLVRKLPDFLFAKVAPINLSIFRIVVFGTLFFYLDPETLVWSSSLLGDLQAIPNSQWSSQLLPANPSLVLAASVGCRILCLLTAFGIATRVSAWAVVITALYAMSATQSFGHINHKCNHLIWFSILLASSRCFDVLSFDAWLRRRVNPQLDAPQPSWRYGFPIKVAWLLLGFVYFFPGFWKIWRFGIDWALSDQLRLILCKGFIDVYPGLTPLVHIEPYPILCQIGGVFAIAFELSFVFLILFDRARVFAVLGGLMFHLSTYVFMGISFWTLPATYFVFINWSAVFKKDWSKSFSGESSFSSISVENKPVRLSMSDFPGLKKTIQKEKRAFAMMVVCASLLIVNGIFGAANKEKSWPFACYPSFAFHFGSSYRSIDVEVFDANGKVIPFDFKAQFVGFYPYRLSFLGHVESISDPVLKERVVGALWNSCLRTAAELKDAAYIKLYTTIIEVDPDRGSHSVRKLESRTTALTHSKEIAVR